MIYYLTCTVVIIISVGCSDASLQMKPLSKSINNASQMDLVNKTKLTSESEGGTVLPNTIDISLPKESVTNLTALDDELGILKKSVVPRKGVSDMLADNTVLKNSSQVLNTLHNAAVYNSSTATGFSDTSENNKKKNSDTKQHSNSTKAHKKPLILSYEALNSMKIDDKHTQIIQPLVTAAPSTKTVADNQIPSPNDKSILKASNANSHPGMIMPIVITILVVPMFAVLGYMALRRGQEAWKNRHYKRMDFLLDGMYND